MENFNAIATIERIKLLRRQYAGKRGKSKFAHLLGISASTYSYYENNRLPPIEILLKICKVTGADLGWLLTGCSTEERAVSGPNAKLLQKLDALLLKNPELTEPILAFIELLCDKKGLEKELSAGVPSAEATSVKANRPAWIPVLGRTAAGMVHFWDKEILPGARQAVTELDELVERHIGKKIIRSADGAVSVDLQTQALIDGVKGCEANLIQVGGQEDSIVEFVQCEGIYKLFADSFALWIDGDSMSPRINDGDIVILSPSVPAAQGQIGIAWVTNQIGVTCKLIRTAQNIVHLIPINERYETKIVAKKDLLWALAVLCHIRL